MSSMSRGMQREPLVLQISLTRVLSVTVSYHAAFAVIALVMLGLDVLVLHLYAALTG